MEIFKKFNLNENESCLICDSLNGTIVDFRDLMWKYNFITDILESIELFRLDKKWLVNEEILIKKLESLSDLDTLALIAEVDEFWGTDEEQYEMFRFLSPKAKMEKMKKDNKI